MDDLTLHIYTCLKRTDRVYRHKKITWKELTEKLSETVRTSETVAEYRKLSRARQNEIKDVGGFVGGRLKNGKRNNLSVEDRCLIALDIDFAEPDFIEMFEMMCGYECVVYSTHKHTPEKPKLRILFPTDRPMTPDEYEPVARAVAEEQGDMDIYDDTTFQHSRMMFWPSTSSDGEYLFKHIDGEVISVDRMLDHYTDWHDTTQWPVSSRVTEIHRSAMKKAGDPLDKEGLIGAFCRTYTIQEAIEKFLPTVYTPTDKPNRWTYSGGSTAGGLVIYDDKFAYSNHATDPASSRLCNAFDLVRIHLFHDADENAEPDTPVNRMPSYQKMLDFCIEDEPTKQTNAEERFKEAAEEFGDDLDDDIDLSWLAKLDTDRKGSYRQTTDNIVLILKNDQKLKDGIGGYDSFHKKNYKLGDLPWWKYSPFENGWTDDDDSALRYYLEKHYEITARGKVEDALAVVQSENAFHPVRDYLDSLKWDGVERLDTIFIDYLGCEDNAYTRAVGRKIFTAAVNRIYEPGCKMDYMPVLIGEQGIGKSHMLRIMGGEWRSDSLSTVTGREAYEALDGVWIMEMGELAAMSSRKADIESVKLFISKQSDSYRKAYGRHTVDYKRQCVFIGTTNDSEFLRDYTGNRRFWPIEANPVLATKDIFTELPKERDQLWAEAVYRYEHKEPLFLSREVEVLAKQAQEDHLYHSTREDLIANYLEQDRPYNWRDMSIQERILWLEDPDENDDLYPCTQISLLEIWCECLNGQKEKIANTDQREIAAILNKLGWERGKNPRYVGSEYGRLRLYSKVKNTDVKD